MASAKFDDFANFFSRACPALWFEFLAQLNERHATEPEPVAGPSGAATHKRVVHVDNPTSPYDVPVSPVSFASVYDAESPAPSAMSTRGPTPIFSDADSGSDMETDSRAPTKPEDEGFTLVQGKKRKRAATKKAAETNSAPPSPTATPAKKPAPASRTQPAKPATKAAAQGSPAERREKAPPPIILQDKTKWSNLSNWLDAKKIYCPKVQNAGQVIRIFVNSTEDYRKVTNHLRSQEISFHTYALPEERNLRVVIRGLPKELETVHILNDLKAQNLPVREVHRMHHQTDKKRFLDLCLVILDLSPEGKEIFNVRRICNLTGIAVEAPRNRGIVGQCHRCQLYGHSARNCYARPRCVKCLGDHGTTDCTRTPETVEPPSCVNCREEGHPANYRGCSKAPRRKRRGGKNRPGRAGQASVSRSRQPAPKPAPSSAPSSAPQTATKPAPATGVPAQGGNLPAPSAPKPNAWVKPPALVASRPAPPAQAPKPKPAQQGTSSFAADFSLVCGFISNINVAELSALARKLRGATTPQDKLNATIEHISLIDAIWNFQCA